MRRFLPVLLLLVLLAGAFHPAAAAGHVPVHVRVVLDLSQSMRKNDPGRLAILSTLLLHDLAQPNSTLRDSFEVIPFDRDWRWQDPAAAPPVSTQPRIKALFGRRGDFVRALQGLPYDARMTYFYPGLTAALGDLETVSAGAYDVRAIVLVTDGVPESLTRDVELKKIRDELAPRLEQHGIRLYVLAFGGEADKNRDFFDQMVRSPQGTSLGEYFVDPQGTELLSYMLQIFARSFGYSPDAAHKLPGTPALDLEAGTTPEKVAVTVFSGRAQPSPRLHLTAPAGGSPNIPEGVQSAGVAGGSYSLAWVMSPGAGDYGFDSDAIPGTVAVLRPTRLALEILPAPPHRQTERAIAGTPFPLQVLVRSPTGAQGDPGPVDLSFQTLGERRGAAHTWEGNLGAPPAGLGTPSARGRVYDIIAEFREDPETPDKTYIGYLDVKAKRGEALVGALTGARAHRVEVHPLLSISPLPLSAYASSSALERRQQACTRFAFHLDAGRLPHADRPRYPVRVVIAAANPAVFDRELNQASFTLDGQALEIDGRSGQQPGAWYKGRTLAPPELLGEHEVCVRIGKPTAGDPARPLELAVAATLLEDPYDDFRVIEPFTLKVLVAPPSFLEKWRTLLLVALALLAVLALLWYLRDRPVVPSDLAYAVGREGSNAALQSRPLEPRSAFARLFGWIGESAVIAPGEDRALGRVRPAGAELYQFRPARGVRVEAADRDGRDGRDEALPLRRGRATLSVHRLYRLRTDRGSYLFRLEYR